MSMNRSPQSWLASVRLCATLATAALATICHAKPFTLAVLPDTQIAVRARPEMLDSQLNWIANNKKALNIPAVLHVGDIVDYHNDRQWQTASDSFQILDKARIPYFLAVGNHDTAAVGENSGGAAPGNVNLNLRNTDKFNHYFPVSRLRSQRGRFEKGKSDNAYYTFKAGGAKWMVVTLEFCSRQGPVDWANRVVAQHPDHNVIVLTHYHLTSKGEIAQSNAGYGNLTCQSVYDQFMKKHANILLVLSGHVTTSAWRTDVGEKGNIIYQVLQDYQSQDSGGGYIRLFDIDTEKRTINARMYSPFYDITKDDFSKFTFNEVKFVAK